MVLEVLDRYLVVTCRRIACCYRLTSTAEALLSVKTETRKAFVRKIAYDARFKLLGPVCMFQSESIDRFHYFLILFFYRSHVGKTMAVNKKKVNIKIASDLPSQYTRNQIHVADGSGTRSGINFIYWGSQDSDEFILNITGRTLEQ